MHSGDLHQLPGLRAYWSRQVHGGGGSLVDAIADRLLFDTLRLGNRQVLRFLLETRPDFDRFCRWIIDTAGPPDGLLLDRYRAFHEGRTPGDEARAMLAAIDAMPPVFSADDLTRWDERGIIVLRQAIPPDMVAAAAAVVWDAAGARPDDPASWMAEAADGIMIPFYRHPALDAVRAHARIHKAFAQLWGTADLWMAIDLVGFNAPVTASCGFRGAPLHWDVSLVRPIPFATQALLYLSDTAADQGAFRAVPGFQHRIDRWLDALDGADPRAIDLSAEAESIPGKAGDLVIWRQDLPHGASPNLGPSPRLVQYLTMYPPDLVAQAEWL